MSEEGSPTTIGESIKWSSAGTSVSMLTDDWQIVACLAGMTVMIAIVEYLRCRANLCHHTQDEKE